MHGAILDSGELIRAALARLQGECADVQGAVVATREGLVLAHAGALSGDVPAAVATHLADHLDRHVRLLRLVETTGTESMFWSGGFAWALVRLPGGEVALVQAARDCSMGTLRLLLRRIAKDVEPLLGTR